MACPTTGNAFSQQEREESRDGHRSADLLLRSARRAALRL
jgi:hypothetical protein